MLFLDGSEDGIRLHVRRVGDDTRDGASVVTLHLPRMSRHRNKRSSANGLSR